MAQRVPILTYHRVHGDEDCPPTPPKDQYCGHVVLGDFERQMAYLAEQGFQSVTHRELTAWVRDGEELPERACAIDFDDNRLNVYENAAPVLEKLGLKATVFVVSQLAEGADLAGMSHPYPAMGWEELEDLVARGWLVGAHTRTHRLLDVLSQQEGGIEECAREIKGAREEIEARMGAPVEHFAYPVGGVNEAVERIVKETYRSARLWSPGNDPKYSTRQTDPYRFEANNICAHLSFDEFKRLVDGALDG